MLDSIKKSWQLHLKSLILRATIVLVDGWYTTQRDLLGVNPDSLHRLDGERMSYASVGTFSVLVLFPLGLSV